MSADSNYIIEFKIPSQELLIVLPNFPAGQSLTQLSL